MSTNNLPIWLSIKQTDIVLSIHAQPGAKKDKVVGEYNNRLKIALAAPPVDGKANNHLIRFLSKKIGVPRSKISLLSGETSREKRLLISDIQPEAVIQSLL